MRTIRQLVFSASMVIAILPSILSAEAPDPIALLLSNLQHSVDTDFILLQGVFPKLSDVRKWQVVVNDAVVLTLVPEPNQPSRLRLPVPLRRGNNSIQVQSWVEKGTSDVLDKRWTTHVYRKPARKSYQWIVLIKGSADDNIEQDLRDFQSVVSGGVPLERIAVADSIPSLLKILDDLKTKTVADDSILIYFRGEASLSASSGEPLLLFRNGASQSTERSRLPLTELTREAADLPLVSLLLDIRYLKKEAAPGQSAAWSDVQAFPWLQRMRNRSNVEIALTNPLVPQTVNIVTADFVSELRSRSTANQGCTSFSDLVQKVSPLSPATASLASLLYFAGRNSFPSYCFSSTPNAMTETILVNTKTPPVVDPWMLTSEISASIPLSVAASWIEVWVDGVLLRRRSLKGSASPSNRLVQEQLAFSEGLHSIEVRAGSGNTVIALGVGSIRMNSKPVTIETASNRLSAAFLRPREDGVATSEIVAPIIFSVGDNDGPIRYELRNNGVVVLREVAPNVNKLQRLEIVRRIPLSIGSNQLVVDVVHDNQVTSRMINIVRKPSDSIHAVIVGVDAPRGLAPLSGVGPDVESMRKFLLQHTGALTDDLVVLSGAKATRQSIIEAMRPRPTSDEIDDADKTLFFYFAGYGTTIAKDPESASIRCILPSDFDTNQAEQTCLSTREMERLLDQWKRSIVLFDTSYDGLAGTQQVQSNGTMTFSRTYKDFLSKDSVWRTSSGTDRPDRIFLVAAETNSPALESHYPPNGIFTRSFIDAVDDRLSTAAADADGLSLFDAFAFGRSTTVMRSGKQQTPLIKGLLSVPFSFSKYRLADLAREAAGTDQSIRDDIRSFRPLDATQVRRASALYNRMLAIEPQNVEAQQGLARVSLYRGDLDSAKRIIDQGIENAESGTDINSRSGMAQWLWLRAILRLQTGNVADALRDCDEAVLRQPNSALFKSLQAGLSFAAGQYDKSVKVLQDLLDHYAPTIDSRGLTDEEWGHILLLAYLSLIRTGSEGNASLLLKSYVGTYEGNRFAKALNNPFVKLVGSGVRRVIGEGNIEINTAWSHLIAEYYVTPNEKNEQRLRSFREAVASSDAKDPRAFDCALHFYLGIKANLDGSLETAKTELRAALETNQKHLLEYWIAAAEMRRLAAGRGAKLP